MSIEPQLLTHIYSVWLNEVRSLSNIMIIVPVTNQPGPCQVPSQRLDKAVYAANPIEL